MNKSLFTRRKLIQLPVFAAPLWLAQAKLGNAGGQMSQPVNGSSGLTWEEFIEQASKEAAPLYKDSSPEGQDQYLYHVASLGVRLAEHPDTKLNKMNGAEFYEFGMAHFGRPFFAVHWRMPPNSVYPAHNHPDYSVCTIGLSGECRIDNFELTSDAPAYNSNSDDVFHIRKTKTEYCKKGTINTCSATRNNIHMVSTGDEAAEGIDITTAYTDGADFSFLRFEDDPKLATADQLYKAKWVGINPQLTY